MKTRFIGFLNENRELQRLENANKCQRKDWKRLVSQPAVWWVQPLSSQTLLQCQNVCVG